MFSLPWIAIFVLSGPWAWLLFLGAFCFLVRLLVDDIDETHKDFDAWPGIAGLFVLASTLILWILFGDALAYLKVFVEHPWKSLLYGFGGYIAGGITWGFFWWWFIYLPRKAEIFEKIVKDWLKSQSIAGSEIPETHYVAFLEYLKDHHRQYVLINEVKNPQTGEVEIKIVENIVPEAIANKARLTVKMGYWPITLFWSLLSEVIKALWRKILDKMRGTLDRMAQRAFSRVQTKFVRTDGETKVDAAAELGKKLTEQRRQEEAARKEREEAARRERDAMAQRPQYRS